MRLNQYCISFQSKALILRAMDDKPWSVMGCCLTLHRWCKWLTIVELDLTDVVFWAQIHNFPLKMMTKGNTEVIGGKIGRPIEVENPMSMASGGR
ncbi:hypothetical protein CRYUN_Cryun29cG0033000 [Craigia yunnanensis]